MTCKKINLKEKGTIKNNQIINSNKFLDFWSLLFFGVEFSKIFGPKFVDFYFIDSKILEQVSK